MMEYKVGDEILIKAVITGSREDESKLLVRTTRNSFLVEKKDVIPAPDMTAEEAWWISKKLFADYSNSELDEIFGKGWSYPKLMELTPHEAKTKIEEWEHRIEVNDEVMRGDQIGVVTHFDRETEFFTVLWKDGNANAWLSKSLKKTGNKIDIAGFLEQIGESDA